jgi:hypothetical protein
MRATGEFLAKAGEKTAISRLPFKMEMNPGYRYSSPSFMGERSTKQRREHGCVEDNRDRWCFKPTGKTEKGKAKGPKCFKTEEEAIEASDGIKVEHKPEKKFNGRRCRSGPREACKDTVYDAFCAGADSDPCSQRSTCPVQLVWVDGKPNLRFCRELGKPGYLVPVPDVKEAMRISDAACAKWPYKLGVVERADGTESEGGWDPDFFNRNAPDILDASKTAYPDRGGLGGVPRRARKRPPNPAWLAAGLAMGVMAAVLLRNRQEPVSP